MTSIPHRGERHAYGTQLIAALAAAAETAAAAVARYDERLARAAPGVAEGALRRADMRDAQALVALRGGSAALEDIVLNDASMDVRTPTTDVVRAVSLLALRRSLAGRSAEAALAPAAVRALVGLPEDEEGSLPTPARRRNEPWAMPAPSDAGDFDAFDEDEPLEDTLDPLEDETPLTLPDPAAQGSLRSALAAADALLARTRRPLAERGEAGAFRVSDPGYDEDGRLRGWLDAAGRTEIMPGAMAAAAALDQWLLLEPSEHRGETGFMLAALMLRRRGLAGRHVPTIALGYHRGRFRWSPVQTETARIAGLLAAIEAGARQGQADLDRLEIAAELLARRCEGRSRNSRLPALAALFVSSPLVTVPMAAKALGVTPQAVEAMLKQFGPSLPRELTGRKRYRAWGVI